MEDNAEYDSCTLNPDNFLSGFGFASICILKNEARKNDSPKELGEDWKTIENWLGCSGRNLDNADKDRIERAWKSYFAVGIAPSLELHSVFNQFHKQAKLEKWEIVPIPSVVRDVFDRLLASDDEIAKKKKSEQKNLKSYIDEHIKNKQNPERFLDSAAMKMQYLNNIQKIILILTSVVLLYVSFFDSDIHLAKIFGIISAAVFLIYGVGRLHLSKPSFVTYQNIKKALYCCLIVVIGICIIFISIQVFEAYKAKAEYTHALNKEQMKTPEEKARDAKFIEDEVIKLRAEDDHKKNEEQRMQRLLDNLHKR